jgi:hypothetical protein
MYAGCVAGALPKEEYLGIIRAAGFANVQVVAEKPITVPDEILATYLSAEELASYRSIGNPIMSITVYAQKESCCAPGCCDDTDTTKG